MDKGSLDKKFKGSNPEIWVRLGLLGENVELSTINATKQNQSGLTKLMKFLTSPFDLCLVTIKFN